MAEWLVRLKGHDYDLEELAGHFKSAAQNVSKDEDGHYYLRLEDVNQMADSHDVHQRALKLIELVNGVASFHSGASYHPVEFDGLTQLDNTGQRHQFVFLSGVIEARSRVSGNPTVIREDGTVDGPQASSEVSLNRPGHATPGYAIPSIRRLTRETRKDRI